MATYSGSDKRIKYLFENGGGGGSSSLAGLSDVNLSSPTDGQVLTYHASSNKWINATGSAGGGVNYSTTEQVVGTWIDGKTLYQKTYAGLSLSCPMANTWYNTNIAFGDIDIITRAEIIDVNGQFIVGTVGNMSNRTYLGINLQISDRTISIITIQYTKSS